MSARGRPLFGSRKLILKAKAMSRLDRPELGCAAVLALDPVIPSTGRKRREAAESPRKDRRWGKRQIAPLAEIPAYDAVFMTNGLPPPGPLLIHTLLDCR